MRRLSGNVLVVLASVYRMGVVAPDPAAVMTANLPARSGLVLLPFESHGYAARENILHMLWEMDTRLETHVREAGGGGGGETDTIR